MKIRSLSILFLTATLVLASCKTQKSRGDLGPLAQFYQNTTAEFNGYFNADVLLTESLTILETSHQDNYNNVLPVFPYMATDNPRSVADPLDRAIEKVTVVVSLHPESHWTDDCYLLMGKAQFLKQDFESAEETFEYLLAEFNPGSVASTKAGKKSRKKSKEPKAKKPKKRKRVSPAKRRRQNKRAAKKRAKERERRERLGLPDPTDTETEVAGQETDTEDGDEEYDGGMVSIGLQQPGYDDVGTGENYGLRHRPAHQEGILWLARTYIEREDFPAAERLMSQLERSPNTFEDIRRDLAPIQAHYHMKRENYPQAILYLQTAIGLESDKLKKARYAFIIAQLYEQQGQSAEAFQYYEEVLDYKPGYELTFSAQLNTIRSAWANGFSTADEARNELEKMTRDIKNDDYLDRIYYTLAIIDMQEGNRDGAIANLRKSLDNSRDQSTQRADSYLFLADLYFEQPEFVSAKSYYDSTLAVMPENDEDYQRVRLMSENLTDIAQNIQIIQLQDSLLRISGMSEDEMRAFAFDIIQRRNEAKRQALLNGQNGTNPGDPRSRTMDRPGTRGPTAAGQSTFFAYDDRAVRRGAREFERDWGDRPLVDNWRRSAVITNNDLLTEEEETEIASSVITDEDIESVLADVPRTEQDIALANRQIEGALFSLGRLYRDRLESNPLAIETLTELMRRYPETDQRVEAWYYLYLAYSEEGNRAEAQKYYDLITSNAPNSTFALILTDPEYANKAMDKEAQLNAYYDEVYTVFQAGNYQQAGSMIVEAREQFGTNNPLQARFALLDAMVTGNKDGKDAYVEALKTVIARYPNSPEETRAKEILRLLGAAVASGPGRTTVNPADVTAAERFEPEEDPTAMHYVMVVFNGAIQLADAKTIVSDFNNQYFNVDRLKVANMYLGDAENRIPVIVIRRFNGADKAMEYYNAVQLNVEDFLEEGMDYKIFPISQTNYRHVLRSKSVEGYETFFLQNYLN